MKQVIYKFHAFTLPFLCSVFKQLAALLVIFLAHCHSVYDRYKTVYVRPGHTAEIEWVNAAITAQIQIWKKSADDNPINGFPAGTPLEGAVFEIYNKANVLVDTIESNSRGLAVSKPLPLGRYIIKEVSSPQFYSVNSEEVTVTWSMRARSSSWSG